MKKKIERILNVMLVPALCLAMAVPVLAGGDVEADVKTLDYSARIEEIEAQIADLQAELNELKRLQNEAEGGSYIPVDEYVRLFTDAEPYTNMQIQIAGEVYGAMEEDEDERAFTMFYDLNGESENVVVICDLSSPEVQEGDYVLVTGTVRGSTTGENAFGGEVYALIVDAQTVELTDYATAVDPPLNTVEPALSAEQYGYGLSVDKIEFSARETRMYLTLTNNGASEVSLDDYTAKVVQNSTQYETEYNYDAYYPELQEEILPGVVSSGVLTFPPMDPYTGITIYLELFSEDYTEYMDPFVFNVEVS